MFDFLNLGSEHCFKLPINFPVSDGKYTQASINSLVKLIFDIIFFFLYVLMLYFVVTITVAIGVKTKEG